MIHRFLFQKICSSSVAGVICFSQLFSEKISLYHELNKNIWYVKKCHKHWIAIFHSMTEIYFYTHMPWHKRFKQEEAYIPTKTATAIPSALFLLISALLRYYASYQIHMVEVVWFQRFLFEKICSLSVIEVIYFQQLFSEKISSSINTAKTPYIPNNTKIDALLYSTAWLRCISILICHDISVLSKREPIFQPRLFLQYYPLYFCLFQFYWGTMFLIRYMWHKWYDFTNFYFRKIFSVLYHCSYIWNILCISNRTARMLLLLYHCSNIWNNPYISGWIARILSLMVVWMALFQKFFFRKYHMGQW